MSTGDFSSLSFLKITQSDETSLFPRPFLEILLNLALRMKCVFPKSNRFWRVDPPALVLESAENHAALKVTDSIWVFKAAAVSVRLSLLYIHLVKNHNKLTSKTSLQRKEQNGKGVLALGLKAVGFLVWRLMLWMEKSTQGDVPFFTFVFSWLNAVFILLI